MGAVDLRALDAAVRHLLELPSFTTTVAGLAEELAESTGTFVWATIDLRSIPVEFPDGIKSGWIFHLRRDVPSGAHYHPNSVQHMTIVAGGGQGIVAGVRRPVVSFHSSAPPEDRWLVIPEGAAHEFVPEGGAMTVISFHTCDSDELEEIECDSGDMRFYT